MPNGGDLINGRYRLLRLIGEGGMGTVWAARNEAIARDVAIKMILPEVAADRSNLQRFFNEARVCGSIRHPGIVDVLDLGHTEGGDPFLVMELLAGAPLEKVLDAFGRLAPSEILPMVRDVARTISLAHARSVIHRDLKPANLFLHRLETGEVVVKVLDFGISKVLAGPDATHATRTGTLVGSPAYMSPEQAAGRRDLSGSTDVYALGVILYEALAGRLPNDGENYNALIVNIAAGRLRPLEEVEPFLPREVHELVRACLRTRPEERMPSALALAERIEALLPLLPAGRSSAALLEGASRLSSVAEAPPAGAEAADFAQPSPVAFSSAALEVAGGGVDGGPATPRRPIRLGRLSVAALVAAGIVGGAIAAAFTLGERPAVEESTPEASPGPEAASTASSVSPVSSPVPAPSASAASPGLSAESASAELSAPPPALLESLPPPEPAPVVELPPSRPQKRQGEARPAPKPSAASSPAPAPSSAPKKEPRSAWSYE